MIPENGTLAQLKHDEYTGENRCIPCTAVNVCIAFVLAIVVQFAMIRGGVPGAALPGSAAVFAVALVVIYFVGYLVPGTPALTKRYFPDWLLAAFGKETAATGLTGDGKLDDGTDDEPLDVEGALVGAGVLTERADGEDLRLAADFERQFDEQVSEVQSDDVTRERLLDLLDIPRGDVAFEEHGTAFRVLRDGTTIGTWESRPAFLADVAAAELLADWLDGWDARPVSQRGELLNGLRLFLTTCPGCGGALSFDTDTVESCCSTHEVAAVTCEDCEARLFESRAIS